jgi:hypothetical protein
MVYANGNVYIGEWENDKLTFGKMEYMDGSVYTGYWYEGQRWQGKMVYLLETEQLELDDVAEVVDHRSAMEKKTTTFAVNGAASK